MSSADQSVTPVALALLDCYATEIAKVASPPASVCMRVGNQVQLLISTRDDECCAGLAWVRIANVFWSSTFPEPDTIPAPCGPFGRAAVLEMGAARCAPTSDADSIPSCDAWTAAALAVQDDRAAMDRAMFCWAELYPDKLWVPGAWEPLPTEGGCVGGTMTITAKVEFCEV